jgi:hypothetical protein
MAKITVLHAIYAVDHKPKPGNPASSCNLSAKSNAKQNETRKTFKIRVICGFKRPKSKAIFGRYPKSSDLVIFRKLKGLVFALNSQNPLYLRKNKV